LNLLRKEEAMVQKKTLVMGRQRWWEGESYLVFVVQGCRIQGESFKKWYQCRLKEKKSDEEAKKEQRNGMTEKKILCRQSGI
jgi:hypothetical protein